MIEFDGRRAKPRIIFAAAIIGIVYFASAGIIAQIADLLTAFTRDSDPDAQEVAVAAMSLAPSDPAAYSLLAASQNPSDAVASMASAVGLSPNDHRLRSQLGRAYEQNEEFEKAASQYEKALELAPQNAAPHWHIGNFYVRQGLTDKALTALGFAAQKNVRYREQVFSLVWDLSGKDSGLLENVVAERPELYARLAYFFAARGRAEESLRAWNKLDEAGIAANGKIAEAIALGLYDQHHYLESLEFSKQFGSRTDILAEAVTNAGFERPINDEDSTARFGWIIPRSDPKFEAVADQRVKREGERSLRLTFKGLSKPDFANVFQTLVVTPGQRYRLSVWVRTENLRSAAMPLLEIIDPRDGRSLARTEAFPQGSNDWSQIGLDFTAPQGSDGVVLRTIREGCAENCPISGLAWYDDLVLSRS